MLRTITWELSKILAVGLSFEGALVRSKSLEWLLLSVQTEVILIISAVQRWQCSRSEGCNSSMAGFSAVQKWNLSSVFCRKWQLRPKQLYVIQGYRDADPCHFCVFPAGSPRQLQSPLKALKTGIANDHAMWQTANTNVSTTFTWQVGQATTSKSVSHSPVIKRPLFPVHRISASPLISYRTQLQSLHSPVLDPDLLPIDIRTCNDWVDSPRDESYISNKGGTNIKRQIDIILYQFPPQGTVARFSDVASPLWLTPYLTWI